MTYTFMDFCAGIGCGRLGLEKAGFHCVAFSEINHKAEKTYRTFFGEEERDSIIETITEYISGGAEYIDKQHEDDRAFEANRIARSADRDAVIENMRKVIQYFK